ncbi:unnamed protein product [Effrenium voratum]|nr:unnamed protein product [Effrenium voratum]
MTPGLAFFYGGLVKDTSVLTMMMQSFISMGVSSIFWFLVGFSLCFGESWGFVGSPWTFFGLRDLNVHEALPGQKIPGLLYMAYQGMFAVITPALMTGAFADRFRFKPYLIFILLWLLFVYCPWCHWLWGGGWLAQLGAVDFAGGIVVHVTAGFSALASLFVLGKREIPEDEKDHHHTPHNVPFVALGTALLWFGWFGFNGGSALASSGQAVAAVVNSEISASVATFLWLLIEWVRLGRPTLIGLCVGAIAGLATITPAAGFIQPSGAFIFGIVATFFCYGCCELINKLGLDDALDVWGVHGMGGWIGSIMIGVLADSPSCADVATAPISCVTPGSPPYASLSLVGIQIAAVLLCSVYSFVVTWVLLKAIRLCMPLKPKSLHVDLHEHHEAAYHSAALESSFEDARREVEQQARRRYSAEHALAAARTEIGRLKAAQAALQAEREGWQQREESYRLACARAEASAQQSAAEAREALQELRSGREELAEMRQVLSPPSGSGGDIEAEVLELCQRLEEEAKALPREAAWGSLQGPPAMPAMSATTLPGSFERRATPMRTLPATLPAQVPLARVSSQGFIAPPPHPAMQRCFSLGSLPSNVTTVVTPTTPGRYYSGPIASGPVGSGTVASADTKPATGSTGFGVGYPVIRPTMAMPSMVAQPMVRQPSTASISLGAETPSRRSQTGRAESIDSSPRRRDRSQSVRKQTSMKSIPSIQSVEEEARADSPRKSSASPSRQHSRQNSRQEETLWEVPYSSRIHSGSLSPRAVSPRSESKRYNDLYQDGELRRQKLQAKSEEKKRQEAQEITKNISSTCSPRHFSKEQFQQWYNESMSKRQETENSRQEKQRCEARMRAFKELSECTFTPMAPLWKAKNGRQRSGSMPSDARPVVHEGDQQALADELVAAQVTQIDALRQLDRKEKEMKEATQQVFKDFLDRSLEEGRRKLRLFEETQEGREYLATRAKSYVELNRGMSHSAALAEARGDLARASEAKLQSHAAQLRQQRVQKDAQQIQLARLKVAWELIQLQRRYSQLLEKQMLPRSMLTSFDASLVERLTKEAWYTEARSFAQNSGKPEVCEANLLLSRFARRDPFAMSGGFQNEGASAGRKDVETSKFYTLLDTNKNASEADIKKAYKRVALKTHPDRGGDPEKFRAITRAYEVLSDAEQRARYDRFGEEAVLPDRMDVFPFPDMFFLPSSNRRRKTKSLVQPLNLTLEQIYQGQTQKMPVTRQVLDPTSVRSCGSCEGQGVKTRVERVEPFPHMQILRSQCDACQGQGKSFKTTQQQEVLEACLVKFGKRIMR